MADQNPKFMAVLACTKDLENGIAANSPTDIGAKLMGIKLLDFEDYSTLRLPSTSQEKAQIIVGAISTKVRAEPDKFDQLMKFVKDGSLGYLHKILEDSLSEQ